MKKQLVLGALLSTALLGSASVWAETADDVDCSGCIQGDEIAKQAITTSKIKGNTIGEAKYKNKSVSTRKIKDNAVTTDKINDRAVTADKLSDEVYDAIGELQTQMADLQQKNSDLQGDLDENRSALEGLCDEIAAPFPNFCPFNIAFVTSTTYTGDLGGLAGADQKCTYAANAAGLPGTYTAWLSSSVENAKDRITDVAYSRMDGAPIASSLADLIDGPLDNAIEIDEYGNIKTDRVWTATSSSGQYYSLSCEDWTNGFFIDTVDPTVVDVYGAHGYPSNVVLWTKAGTSPTVTACNIQLPLYCFQD